MSSFIRKLLQRRSARLSFQVAVSVALIMLLVWLVRQGNLDDERLKSIQPDAVALAALVYLAAAFLAIRRWQVLLRCRGIVEPWTRLAADYFLGMFCSTFLPTSVGGDAVRVYEVSRRSHSLRLVVLATFQDRLLGFGLMMAVGMVAALCFLSLLPASLAAGFFLLHLAGLLAVVALLNPRVLLACCEWVGKSVPGLRHMASSPRGERVRQALRRLLDEPPLHARDLLHLLALGAASFSLSIAAHQIIAHSLGIDIGFLAFCLIVSLVWVVKLLPVSLGGLGVGEGALVGLLWIFGAPTGRSGALAVVMLAIQTGTSLLGGLVALARVLRLPKAQVQESVPVEGERRHAA
jgi:uncharacterized protein (TIRG00374 family)